MINRVFLTVLLFPLVSFAGTCGNMPIQVYDIYAVTSERDDQLLDVYATIRNKDPLYTHTLTGVSSPGPRSAVIQSYAANSIDNDSRTATVGEINIPAKGVYMFRPGHTHIVLSGYKYRPDPDDIIEITFEFANECRQSISSVPVNAEG
jgi:copper(I)-binding protein